jgi:hypothetical protein
MIEKVCLFSKKPLNGLIKLKDFFQIYPEEVDFKKGLPISERKYPLILEIHVDHKEDYSRFGIPKGIADLERIVFEFIELITVVLKHFIWGYKFKESLTEFSDQSFRKLAKVGEPELFQNLTRIDRRTEEILIPIYWEQVIKNYYSLESEERQIARKALKLFYDGIKLEPEHPSLSFISMISLIETLISFYCKGVKINHCEKCGQPKYKVRKKFLSFTQEFSKKNDIKHKKYLVKLYDLRSSILHQGMLLLSDERFLTGEYEFDPENDDHFVRINTTLLTRVILINWIISDSDEKLYKISK